MVELRRERRLQSGERDRVSEEREKKKGSPLTF